MTFIINGCIVSGLFLLLHELTGVEAVEHWMAYGSSCYFISTTTEMYASLASIECLKIGAHLVEVTSFEEEDNIIPYLNLEEEYWVGMEKNDTGDFVWILDRSGPLVPWASWDVQTSDTASMVRYRRMNNMWSLNMRTNPMAFRYICEKRKSYKININCINDKTGQKYLGLKDIETSSSSIFSDHSFYDSPKATDDSLSSCALSKAEDNPWWQIDLSKQALVHNVEIASQNCCGTDGVLQSFLVSAYVTEPDQEADPIISHTCGFISLNVTFSSSAEVNCAPNTIGRYIRITKQEKNSQLVLCDIKIKGTICTTNITEKTCSSEKSVNTYDFNVTELTTTTVTVSSSVTSCQFDDMVSTLAFTTSSPQSSIIPTSTISVSSTPSYSSIVTYQEDFDEIVRKMRVDKKGTNAYRRSLISAEDERVSSRVSGFFGVVILVTVLCIFLFFDALRFYQFLAMQRQ